jgi:N-acyl-D-amino-acid deacylase
MTFDIIIRGGRIADGSGKKKAFRADVGIAGDRITAVGDLSNASAPLVIDAKGKIVAPGFIDMHTHSDFTSLGLPTADSKIMSGVTTEVLGSCGGSAFPLRGEARERRTAAFEREDYKVDWEDAEGYIRKASAIGCSTNRVLMLGHNMLRGSVMGYGNRKPAAAEMRKMLREVHIALDAGVFGLTSGLIYPPGCFAATDELVELCKPVAKRGGIYASHIRSEGDGLEDSIDEIIAIGERSGVAVHVSHLKTSRPNNWHKIGWLKDRLFSARKGGIDLTADRYPYLASSTGVDSVFPEWVYEGSEADEIARLRDPATRAKIREETGRKYASDADWHLVQIAYCSKRANRKWEGKRVTEIAKAMRLDPFDAACELVIADGPAVSAVFFHMKAENLAEILSWPFVMIGSDASARSAAPGRATGKPHPRAYGTSARVLEEFVREKKVLTLEEAVWKLAGFPANRLGLADRGRIAKGKAADVTVFDLERVTDLATYDNPHRYPAGIEQVIVNGKLTADRGKHLGTIAGRILRKA